MRPYSLSVSLLMALAVLGGPMASSARAQLPPPAQPLGPAPAWHFKDYNGNEVRAEDFKGKVVVLDFWAVWCGPCKEEIPGYVDLQKKYGKDGLVIIGVVFDQEEPAKVKKFVDQYMVSYKIVQGTDDMEAAFGGMDAIPTTFLIDRDGVIRDRKVGTVPTAEYEQRILRYLKPADTRS